jgi:anti-anti-sigma regulatory factor
MIYIKEKYLDDRSVAIHLEGILDDESIPTLKEICETHLLEKRKILLNLKDVLHINREGQEFLREIQKKVRILELPKFIGMKDHLPHEKE